MNTQAPPAWMDYNNADSQTDFSVIPDNTAVRMALTIRRSQYDPQPGQSSLSPEECAFFSGGYLTFKHETGTVYIDCEFTVTGGQYKNRKVWQLIGVHSPKGPEWGNMGRAMVRAILESARGVSPMDQSPQAQDARRITHVSQLESLEFAALLTIEKGNAYTDSQGQQKIGQDRNKIKKVICPDDARWQPIMSGQVGDIPDPTGPSAGGASAAAPWAGQAPAAPVQGSVPPWAAPQPQPAPAPAPQTAAPPPAAPAPQPVTYQPPPVTPAPTPHTGGASGPVPAWMNK